MALGFSFFTNYDWCHHKWVFQKPTDRLKCEIFSRDWPQWIEEGRSRNGQARSWAVIQTCSFNRGYVYRKALSELSCVGWKWPGFYNLRSVNYQMTAALGEAWPQVRLSSAAEADLKGADKWRLCADHAPPLKGVWVVHLHVHHSCSFRVYIFAQSLSINSQKWNCCNRAWAFRKLLIFIAKLPSRKIIPLSPTNSLFNY